MRILHVTNFQYDKDGRSFANQDQKIQIGLVRNGHFTYSFPFNDIARARSCLNSKNWGSGKANSSLIESCLNIQPNLLLLSHTQLINVETFAEIRRLLPNLKIAQWFVDSLEFERGYGYIFDRLPYLDAIFFTSAGIHIEKFNIHGCRSYFFPNIVEHNLENMRAFNNTDFEYDVVFVGTDRKDQKRRDLLSALNRILSPCYRVGIFGSLGRPGVYGTDRDKVLSSSKIALNLSRTSSIKWYSSDRISQLMGNGVLACTSRESGLGELYGNDSLLFFDQIDDLVEKIRLHLEDDSWRDIAKNGWEFVHKNHDAKSVTAKMIEQIFLDK